MCRIDAHQVRVSRTGMVKIYGSTRELSRQFKRGTGQIVSASICELTGQRRVYFKVEVERPLALTCVPVKFVGIDVGRAAFFTGATSPVN